ncbi:putative MFS transporter [Aureobasidium pullulans]|uniref:Putative MFS transporter n=1 Tax=Aureobasidium pullulans TaxID=5580 RepID=A0A4V6T934_AURPU|nr:putative MFS transporter [Aureobasidium pullulans]THW24304.1 putative MFS transporter [Aureobasidium pullulans]
MVAGTQDCAESPQVNTQGHVHTHEEPSTPFNPSKGFYLAFLVLTVLAMMVSLDGTSVSVALPIIANTLDCSTMETFWIGAGFLLSSATILLPLGALSIAFGRVPILVICACCFLVGIIVSGFAQGASAMLTGRIVQGVGGGGLILLNDIVITDLVPLSQRGNYFGIIGSVWALGSVSGPVIGGALAYKASWRWIFWINIPFAVTALVMLPLLLKLTATPGTFREQLKRFDYVGSFLCVSCVAAVLIPITWGGIEFSWSSWQTLLPLVLGLAGLAGFCSWQIGHAKEPILRLGLLRSYNMGYSLFATMINALIVYGALYFLPLYYEAVKEYTPVLAGVSLFPATFTVAPLSIITGCIVTKTQDYRVLTFIGWFTTTLGLGLVCLLDVDTSVVQWVFLSLVPGIGLGILYTSLSFVNQAASTDTDMAYTVTLFVFFRTLGQCVGVAIGSAIFQNRMFENLRGSSFTSSEASNLARDAVRLVEHIKTLAKDDEKAVLVEAFVRSLQVVWAAMCGMAGLALIGSAFLKNIPLRASHHTDQALACAD